MTIEERVEALETSLKQAKKINRSLLVLMLIGLAIGSVGAVSMDISKEIQANKFTLIDDEGRMRASLCMEKGGPELFLYDEQGAKRGMFGIDNQGPTLALIDEKQNIRGIFGLTASDDVSFAMTDKKELKRLFMTVVDGEPAISLNDQDGKTRAAIVVTDKLGPGFAALDALGNPVWSMPKQKTKKRTVGDQ